MDKIICLVGASGSGKTTIAKRLEKEGYNIIHSYTTRPPREPGEWGHAFINGANWYEEDVFLGADENYENEIEIHASEMIAFFNDYFKGEVYFATKEQYQGKGTSIYVVDPEGAEQVQKNVQDAEVTTIFLMADENIRYKRMVKERGHGAVERIEKDKEIFKTCKCDYVVDANRDIDSVVLDVLEIL